MSTTTESTALALIPPSALPTILAADGLDDKMARTAVMAIALGKIPHCRISY